VAVIVADSTGTRGGILAAPIGDLNLAPGAEGMLDTVIGGMRAQFEGAKKPTVLDLVAWRAQLTSTIYLTEPQQVGGDADAALLALYEAYVAPRATMLAAQSKRILIDTAITELRTKGFEVSRGTYIDDFVFDIVIRRPQSWVVGVFSFANPNRDWAEVEREAAHFAFAVERLRKTNPGVNAAAIIQAAPQGINDSTSSTQRVGRWLQSAGVRELSPDTLDVLAHDPQQLSFSAR
jgi:hypothetical protein